MLDSTLLRILYIARLVTLFFFFLYFCPENKFRTIPKNKSFFYNCRLIQLTELDISINRIRFCYCCDCLSKLCRIQEDSDKCVKCIKKSFFCNLISLNTARWRRLEMQQKALKQQLRNTVIKRCRIQTKEDRLLSQLKYVENKQQTIVNRKLQNLKKLALLAEKSVFELFSESLIDIVSKQIVFSNIIKE